MGAPWEKCRASTTRAQGRGPLPVAAACGSPSGSVQLRGRRLCVPPLRSCLCRAHAVRAARAAQRPINQRDPVATTTNLPDSAYKTTPMTWKHTPAMAGEKSVVDKVQLTCECSGRPPSLPRAPCLPLLPTGREPLVRALVTRTCVWGWWGTLGPCARAITSTPALFLPDCELTRAYVRACARAPVQPTTRATTTSRCSSATRGAPSSATSSARATGKRAW